MSANQVVLYFDKQEDALLFTLAASSVMSAEGPVHRSDAVVKVRFAHADDAGVGHAQVLVVALVDHAHALGHGAILARPGMPL